MIKKIILLIIFTLVFASCSKNKHFEKANEKIDEIEIFSEQSIILKEPIPFPNLIQDEDIDSLDNWKTGSGTIDLDGLSLGSQNWAAQSVSNLTIGLEYIVRIDLENLANVSGLGGIVRVYDGNEETKNPSGTLIKERGLMGVSNSFIEFTFEALSSSAVIHLSVEDPLLDSVKFKSASLKEVDENSSDVIDFGLLKKVGTSLQKRLYIKNSTGLTQTVSFDISTIPSLSIRRNRCDVPLEVGDICYIDFIFSVNSINDEVIGNRIVDFVPSKPANASDIWGRVSFIGGLSDNINSNLVTIDDIVLQFPNINFGIIPENEELIKRVYISNRGENTIAGVSLSVDAPFVIEKNACGTSLKARRICYVDIKYIYSENETISSEDNKALRFSHGSIDLSQKFLPLIAQSSLVNNNPQFATSIQDKNGADIDLSDNPVGFKKQLRLYIENTNRDFDFSLNPISVIGSDVVIVRNLCNNLNLLSGKSCYLDVRYERKEIPEITKLNIGNELELEFSLPKGVFGKEYFDAAVFK